MTLSPTIKLNKVAEVLSEPTGPAPVLRTLIHSPNLQQRKYSKWIVAVDGDLVILWLENGYTLL